jgi:hypothetical protein
VEDAGGKTWEGEGEGNRETRSESPLARMCHLERQHRRDDDASPSVSDHCGQPRLLNGLARREREHGGVDG